jgi:hypothetical protein
MTIRHRQTLKALLDRVAEPSNRQEKIFHFDEIALWPIGAVDQLISAGLLETTTRVEMVVCLGCEERCYRPVTLIGAAGSHAYSTCHLFSDRGPFQHPLDRLDRWSSSRQLVAEFVASSFRLKIRDFDPRWRRIKFGVLRIEGIGLRQISLEFNGTTELLLGSMRVPLIEFIEWSDKAIRFDRAEVEIAAAAATDKQSGNKRVQSSTTIRDDHRTLTEIRNRNLQRAMEKAAGEHPKLNKHQLAKIIERSGRFEEMTASRIARVTRMPKKVRRKNFASSPEA